MKGIRLLHEDGKPKPWLVYVNPSVFGKRKRERFKTKAEAQSKIRVLENRVINKERVALDPEVHNIVAVFQDKFTPDEWREILENAVAKYKQGGGSIGSIGDLYLAEQERALKRGSISEIFVKHIRGRLPKFKDFFGNTPCRDITQEMVEQFVDKHLDEGKAKRTIKNYCALGSAIFNYGIRRRYLEHNPVKEVNLGSCKSEVGILTPKELQLLLNHSCHFMQVWLMFGSFGGLRSSEISLVDWDDVDLDEGQFYVKGKKNVCAERWVTLSPPLKDFCKKILEVDDPPTGPIMAGMANGSIERRRDKAMKKSGVKIPRNAARHSYASHHLVHYKEPNVTAAEMGHVGPQMTFAAYRKAVKKSDAAIYWNVRIDKPLPIEPVEGRKSRWARAA